MKYYAKIFSALFGIFFFNITFSVGLGDLARSTYRATINHQINSNHTSKWSVPKSISDPFVKKCIFSSSHNYSYKAPSPAGPNENWTKNEFKMYCEKLYHNDHQKILEQLPLYAYQGFRQYVATFQEYPQFVRNLCDQLDNKPFCRTINQYLTQSHEFQMSNQWHARIPVNVFYDLKNELPPANYDAKRIDGCQQNAQQNAANKQQFIDNTQQVLQDIKISPQHTEFALDIQNAALTTDGSCTTQKLEATPELLAAAQQQQLSKQEVEITYGDNIKHGVQKGLVTCGNEAAQQKDSLSGDVTKSAILGIEYNQAGFTKKALLIADLCHVALDYTRKFFAFERDLAHGVVFGCADACANVSAMIQDPEKAIIDMAHGLAHLSYYISKTIIGLADPMFTPVMLRSEDAYQEHEQFVSDFKQTTAIAAKGIIHTFVTTPTRDLVRKAVAFGVEGWLTNRALLGIGSLFSKTGQLSTVVSQRVKNIAHGAEVLEPVAAGVGEIKELGKWQTWWNQIKDEIKGVAGIVPKVTREVKHVLPSGMNLDNLKQAYQTIAARFGKTLDFAYEHIFGIEDIAEIKTSGLVKNRWKGFHHDYMGRMEKKGIVTFTNETVCPKTGIIKANVSYNGIVKEGKTFFPREWSPEKVIEKITEAYNNFSDLPRWEGTSQIYDCFTNEGMKIRIVFTEQGIMVTAYPMLGV
jgi:hypothetical protein